MRKVIQPVLPACTLAAVIVGILIVAEPVIKMAVETMFTVFGS